MTPAAVVNHFGSVRQAAKELDLTTAAIYQWRRNKVIPYASQLVIEKLTDGKLKAKK